LRHLLAVLSPCLYNPEFSIRCDPSLPILHRVDAAAAVIDALIECLDRERQPNFISLFEERDHCKAGGSDVRSASLVLSPLDKPARVMLSIFVDIPLRFGGSVAAKHTKHRLQPKTLIELEAHRNEAALGLTMMMVGAAKRFLVPAASTSLETSPL